MTTGFLARTGLRAAGRSAAQRTQRRTMGHGPFTDKMNVKKNKFVEEWNGRREITELAFEVGPSNLPALLLTCVVFPFGIYYQTRKELIIKGDPRYRNAGLWEEEEEAAVTKAVGEGGYFPGLRGSRA